MRRTRHFLDGNYIKSVTRRSSLNKKALTCFKKFKYIFVQNEMLEKHTESEFLDRNKILTHINTDNHSHQSLMFKYNVNSSDIFENLIFLCSSLLHIHYTIKIEGASLLLTLFFRT